MSGEKLPFCLTISSSNELANREFVKQVRENTLAVTVSPFVTLFAGIRYVIVPFGSSVTQGNITDASVQAQHQVLNQNYLAYQGSEYITGTNPHYLYNLEFGNPNIQFYPLNVSEITTGSVYLQRMNVPQNPPSAGYSSVQDVYNEYQNQGGKINAGVIYVFITHLQEADTGDLLGQAADIPSNYCMIGFSTVGNKNNPGSFSGYAYGGTLIHEIGHCLGLYHPFASDDGTCQGAEVYTQTYNPQSPLQYLPNYSSYCFLSNLTSPGLSGNGFDNRGRDYLRSLSPGCNQSTPPNTSCGLFPNDVNPPGAGNTSQTPAYSCATSSEIQSSSLPWETFFIFMDYSSDSSRIGFLSFTTNLMRQTLINNPQLFSVTYGPQPTVTVSTTQIPSTSSLTQADIIGIIVACVVSVLIVIIIVIWVVKNKQKKVAFSQNKIIKPVI